MLPDISIDEPSQPEILPADESDMSLINLNLEYFDDVNEDFYHPDAIPPFPEATFDGYRQCELTSDCPQNQSFDYCCT